MIHFLTRTPSAAIFSSKPSGWVIQTPMRPSFRDPLRPNALKVWAKEKADQLGVMGWVRNRLDGDVEGLFVGPEDAVDALVAVCREGPRPALIDEIKIEPAQGVTPANFQIKPTV